MDVRQMFKQIRLLSMFCTAILLNTMIETIQLHLIFDYASEVILEMDIDLVCCQLYSLVFSFKESVTDVAAHWIISAVQLRNAVSLFHGAIPTENINIKMVSFFQF